MRQLAVWSLALAAASMAGCEFVPKQPTPPGQIPVQSEIPPEAEVKARLPQGAKRAKRSVNADEAGLISIERHTAGYTISMVLDATEDNVYFVMDLPEEEMPPPEPVAEEAPAAETPEPAVADEKEEEPPQPEAVAQKPVEMPAEEPDQAATEEVPPAEEETPPADPPLAEGQEPQAQDPMAQAPLEEPPPPRPPRERPRFIDENQAGKHIVYAQTYFFEQKYVRALDEVSRAISYSPRSAVAYSLKGSIHYKRGEFADARKAWEKALALDPNLENVPEMLERLKN